MKALIQRVKEGSVTIDGDIVGRIGKGFVVLLGVCAADGEKDARYLAHRTANLRVFPDDEQRMNLSLQDIDGDVLVISQFTLYADTRKGHRPSFAQAAPPGQARTLYEAYVGAMKQALGEERVATGRFGAMMTVHIVNDGPVTIELVTDHRHGLRSPLQCAILEDDG